MIVLWRRAQKSVLTSNAKIALVLGWRSCNGGDGLAPRIGELRLGWLVYDEALRVGCQKKPMPYVQNSSFMLLCIMRT